jgi:tRNA-dihydrouridine synthase B
MPLTPATTGQALPHPAGLRVKDLCVSPPFGMAPMAGLTDSPFRRLVKRFGGCGLVVSEMVSSEGLVRGIDRTLEYAEFTSEERPVAIQIFGGDPAKMAAAAQVVEARGADAVDVNMGCPVPKIANHDAGCSLMRDPERAARIVREMVRAVGIPVTVKMRAGWDERETNAPELARMLEDAGAAAVTVHGRTAAQSYSGESDWELIARVAHSVSIPVFGNGDCVEPHQVLERLRGSGVGGVLVGRGVLRNPWLLAQAADLLTARPARLVSLADRGRFLLEYIELLLGERRDEPEPPSAGARGEAKPALRHDRWVINKLRALVAWYSKGLIGGSHLRVAVNHAESVGQLRDIITGFFCNLESAPRTHP